MSSPGWTCPWSSLWNAEMGGCEVRHLFVAVFALWSLALPFSSERAEAAAPPPVSQAQAALYAKANDLYRQGRYEEVTRLLADEVSVSEMPHPYVSILLGVSQMSLGRNDEAVATLDKALSAYPEDPSLRYNYAVALMRGEQHAKAAAAFQKAAEVAAPAAAGDVRFQAAQCWNAAEQNEKALDLLTPLCASGAAKNEWLYLAAVLNVEKGSWKNAEGYFHRLVTRNPQTLNYWKGLAHTRLQQGDKDGAIAALEIASRLHGATEREKRELAQLYHYASAPLLALETQKTLPNTTESSRMRLRCLERANRNLELAAYAAEQNRAAPNAELCWIEGVAHYRAGKRPEARRAFVRGAELAGNDAQRCRLMVGLLAWEAGDFQAAREAFSCLSDSSVYGSQARQALDALDSLAEGQAALLPF